MTAKTAAKKSTAKKTTAKKTAAKRPANVTAPDASAEEKEAARRADTPNVELTDFDRQDEIAATDKARRDARRGDQS
jgi:hypothetical protein